MAVCALLVSGSAGAHSFLVASEPAAGAVLNAPPAALVLQFSAPVEPAFSRVELRQRTIWRRLDVTTEAAGVRAVLPALAPGEHRVRWSVLARDGHRQQGVLAFRLR